MPTARSRADTDRTSPDGHLLAGPCCAVRWPSPTTVRGWRRAKSRRYRPGLREHGCQSSRSPRTGRRAMSAGNGPGRGWSSFTAQSHHVHRNARLAPDRSIMRAIGVSQRFQDVDFQRPGLVQSSRTLVADRARATSGERNPLGRSAQPSLPDPHLLKLARRVRRLSAASPALRCRRAGACWRARP